MLIEAKSIKPERKQIKVRIPASYIPRLEALRKNENDGMGSYVSEALSDYFALVNHGTIPNMDIPDEERNWVRFSISYGQYDKLHILKRVRMIQITDVVSSALCMYFDKLDRNTL